MRRSLRTLVLACGLLSIVLGLTAGTALAGGKSKDGFYVFKDMRTFAVAEFRDTRGKLVRSNVERGLESPPGTACGDSRHVMVGARWDGIPSFFVNVFSLPAELDPGHTLSNVRAAHAAWQDPWTTDCERVPGPSPYGAVFAGLTANPASLATLQFDGLNSVEFRSLRGTVCDGAVACVVAFSHAARFVEADMALEAELSRFGGDYRWTNGDTTWFTGAGGEFAVLDVATHEWGHFAGLGHTNKSPELTMFPFIHDGMQTLGLGDMKGLRARY